VVVVVPIPAAVTDAMRAAQADTHAHIAHVNADSDAVSDMGARTDTADMGTRTNIAVTGLSTCADGTCLAAGADLRGGCSGGQQGKCKD